jgi:regulator of ribosome biosynthesis
VSREKPLPKAKPETRWERFAKAKGIQQTKRSRMVFDEAAQEYKPRFGYKRANDVENDWLIPVPEKSGTWRWSLGATWAHRHTSTQA